MPFYIRVPSLITPVHCITKTEEPNFPTSVGLIGLRDVRDYKVASGGSDRLNTSSPFNIKVASLTMRNFNLAEVG